MATPAFLDALKAYVGFTDASTALLRALHPLAEPHFGAIVDDFYAAIERHPSARRVFTGGDEQVARLKTTLHRWLNGLLLGPHDDTYFEARAKIGRVHVRIGLEQSFMLTAMNRIRVRMSEIIAHDMTGDIPTRLRTAEAVHQILDLDLAIMLETYREDLLDRARAAERLATIGQFAAGIGHELRNPLGVIESSLFLLRQRAAKLGVDDPSVHKHLDKIGVEVRRSNKTITDLLELARNRPPQRHRTEVAAVVAEAVAAAALPQSIDLAADVEPDLACLVDPDQIRQVLLNLLVNAREALGGRGRIAIVARRRAGVVDIRVADDGPGVPPDARPRIFEALYTTKAKGSGLGLALCRKIAEAHGGSIVLELGVLEPGVLEPDATGRRGASFLLTLPDVAGQPAREGAP